MEEAENLCERIGVMVSGKLRSIGTAEQLKKISKIYQKLSVVFHPHIFSVEEISSSVELELHKELGYCKKTRSFKNITNYEIKLDGEEGYFTLMKIMIERAETSVQDWSISEGSLGEVMNVLLQKYKDS